MPNKVQINNSELKRYTNNGSSSKTSQFITKQRIGKIELLSDNIKWVIDFQSGKFLKFTNGKLESQNNSNIGDLLTDLIELIRKFDFDSVQIYRRTSPPSEMNSVKNFKTESKKLIPSAKDISKWFDMAVDTSGWNPEYDTITKKIFGGDWIAPDILSYFDVVKKKPNGKQLFVDYMINKRPKGKLYMTPDKRIAEPIDNKKSKLESSIRKIVKEIRRNKNTN